MLSLNMFCFNNLKERFWFFLQQYIKYVKSICFVWENRVRTFRQLRPIIKQLFHIISHFALRICYQMWWIKIILIKKVAIHWYLSHIRRSIHSTHHPWIIEILTFREPTLIVVVIQTSNASPQLNGTGRSSFFNILSGYYATYLIKFYYRTSPVSVMYCY